MGELGFSGISKIDETYRNQYLAKKRRWRLSAFDGKQYDEDVLVLLKAESRSKNTTSVPADPEKPTGS